MFCFCITHILNTGCAKIWKKIRRQKVKQLLAQHNPLLGYTSLSSLWAILKDFTEPFLRGTALSFMDIRLCSFLVNVEVPYPVKQSAACRFWLFTNCKQPKMKIWRHISTGITWSISAHVHWELFPRFSSTRNGNEAAVFFSQACKTNVIWWWKSVLRLQYQIITCAVLQLVICWNSSLSLHNFRKQFVGHLRTPFYDKCTVINNDGYRR